MRTGYSSSARPRSRSTPHNGYSESFTALLELLDNQRFARGMFTDTKEFMRQRDAVMVRRLKSELPKDDFGQDRFPKRVLEALEVDYPHEEKRIHAALREYTARRQARAQEHAERFATDFVLMTLKKRLFSSPAAFLRTLEQHENSLQTARKRKGGSKPTRGILQHRSTGWKKNIRWMRRPTRRSTRHWTPPRCSSRSQATRSGHCSRR